MTGPSLALVFNNISPFWLLLEGVYFFIALILLGVAYRAKSEWVKASLGVLAMAILAWHILAVLPSWWLYYADGVLGWGGNGCTKLDPSCFKQIGKDLVVVAENGVGLGALVVGFLMFQKKFPKHLAAGEPKRETTGGYK